MAMPALPLIPALTGEAEALPLSELIAALSDDDVVELENAAADWKFQQEGAPAEDAAVPDEEATESIEDEAAETPEEQEAEAEAGEEQHSAREMVEAARAAKYAIDDVATELQQLADQADEHKKAGVDIDTIEAQLDIVLEAQEQAEALLETAQEGSESEDLSDASKAAAEARKLAKKAEVALKTAKRAVATSAKAALDTAVPEHVLAMDAWAKKFREP